MDTQARGGPHSLSPSPEQASGAGLGGDAGRGGGAGRGQGGGAGRRRGEAGAGGGERGVEVERAGERRAKRGGRLTARGGTWYMPTMQYKFKMSLWGVGYNSTLGPGLGTCTGDTICTWYSLLSCGGTIVLLWHPDTRVSA